MIVEKQIILGQIMGQIWDIDLSGKKFQVLARITEMHSLGTDGHLIPGGMPPILCERGVWNAIVL